MSDDFLPQKRLVRMILVLIPFVLGFYLIVSVLASRENVRVLEPNQVYEIAPHTYLKLVDRHRFVIFDESHAQYMSKEELIEWVRKEESAYVPFIVFMSGSYSVKNSDYQLTYEKAKDLSFDDFEKLNEGIYYHLSDYSDEIGTNYLLEKQFFGYKYYPDYYLKKSDKAIASSIEEFLENYRPEEEVHD